MADYGHRPAGMSQGEFGDCMWGNRPEDARNRWRTITRQELVDIGLDCEMAKYWREFYRDQYIRNKGGASARPRWRLMKRCSQLLEC